MLNDARQLPSGSLLEADVAIVGAGAAGITLARELARSHLRVCLLEGGGLEDEPRSQALYRGENAGRAYHPLDASRTRRFGGSTNCWTGLCRPLAALDLETREWIPHSGWPFDRAHLEPYYARAQESCLLGPPRYDGEAWTGPSTPVLPLGADWQSRVWQIRPTRFGSEYRAEISAATGLDAWLHANAVELVANESASAIDELRIATFAGGEHRVRARAYVLASGGIENARMLLASRAVQGDGLGNGHDLVGRFFMEHPEVRVGAFLPSAGRGALGLYLPHALSGKRSATGVMGLIEPTAALQRRERLAASMFWLAAADEARGFERSLARSLGALEPAARGAARERPALAQLWCGAEQVPHRESRVMLSDERDELGVPRVRLAWRLQQRDLQSFRRSLELAASGFALAGAGRVRVDLEPSTDWPEHMEGMRHHMGTTRMHEDARQGVVDANARVHGVHNLFVAGSSVFPTSGAANPTLTLVALAHRLADRLVEVLA